MTRDVMDKGRPFRLGLGRVVLLAAALGLLCATPAFVRVPSVGAQACMQYSTTTGQCIQYGSPASSTATGACTQYSTTTGQCIQYASSATAPAATGACTQYSTTTGQCIQYGSPAASGASGACVQYSTTTGQCIQYGGSAVTVIGTGTGTGTCAQYSTTTGQCTQYASPATSTATGACTQYSTSTGQCIQYGSPATSPTASAATGACTQYSTTTGQCIQYGSSTTALTTSASTGATCLQYSPTPGPGGAAVCVQNSSPTTSTPTASTTGTCTQYSPTPGPGGAAQCIQYASSTTSTTAAATNTCPAGQFQTASGCSASTVQQTCPGSGIPVTPAPGQSLAQACPVVCYTALGFPQINGAGATCPSGTTSTPPGGTAATMGATSASTYGSAATNLPGSPAPLAAGGIVVTLNAGWNIVAGPTGTMLTGAGPTIFTLQANDNGNYESLPNTTPLKGGEGYWAQFSAATTVNLPAVPSGSTTVPLPAGQAVIIGNGGDTVATVTGMDSLVVWDPVQQTWTQTTTLKAGQGGFATSKAGGQATISWGSAAPTSGSTPAEPAS